MDTHNHRRKLKQEQADHWRRTLPGSKVTCSDTADGFTITTDPGHRPQPSVTMTYGPAPIPEGFYRAMGHMRQLREDLKSLGFRLK